LQNPFVGRPGLAPELHPMSRDPDFKTALAIDLAVETELVVLDPP
jgi:hypothetical protein